MNWITTKKFSELSGYTAKAVYNKTSKGVWRHNVIWRKAPDGRVLISIEEYERWVESSK